MPGNLLRTDTFTKETAPKRSLHVACIVRLRATAHSLFCPAQEHRGVLLLDAIHAAQNPRGWESHGLEFNSPAPFLEPLLHRSRTLPSLSGCGRFLLSCLGDAVGAGHRHLQKRNFSSEAGTGADMLDHPPPSEAPCSAPTMTRLAPVGLRRAPDSAVAAHFEPVMKLLKLHLSPLLSVSMLASPTYYIDSSHFDLVHGSLLHSRTVANPGRMQCYMYFSPPYPSHTCTRCRHHNRSLIESPQPRSIFLCASEGVTWDTNASRVLQCRSLEPRCRDSISYSIP